MTIVAYPLNGVTNTAESVRQAMSAFLGLPPSGRPLGATSGIRPGTPTSIVTATATVWTVKPHSGVLDLETSATSGPLPYAVTANETGSVTAANATLDRIDLLSLRSDEPEESDGSSTPQVVVVYTVGTAASSPVAPATPAGNMALAQLRVPAGGGTPTVTIVAPPLLGTVTPIASASARPTVITPGSMFYNYTSDAFEVWDGTAWNIFTGTESQMILRSSGVSVPDSTAVTPTSGWTTTGGWNIGGITYSAGTLVAAHTGIHQIDWFARWNPAPTSTTAWLRQVSFTVNGSGVGAARQVIDNPANFASSLTYMSSSGKLWLNAGDVVAPLYYQAGTSGSSTVIVSEGHFGLTYVGAAP